jgi:hypothetical protein
MVYLLLQIKHYLGGITVQEKLRRPLPTLYHFPLRLGISYSSPARLVSVQPNSPYP